jgi:signal transduction histidine kinase
MMPWDAHSQGLANPDGPDARSYSLALLNILEDAAREKSRLQDTQSALLNILDDFNLEKVNVEKANARLRNEIAERKRTEIDLARSKAIAEAASKELEAFSHSVAHDLRAPLRSISGFGQALLDDCADQLDTEGKRYLAHIREAASQMGDLIDDLLNLSRVTRTWTSRRARAWCSEGCKTRTRSARSSWLCKRVSWRTPILGWSRSRSPICSATPGNSPAKAWPRASSWLPLLVLSRASF